MTTIKHVIDGLSVDGLRATVLWVAAIVAVGYVLGQLLRGWSSRGRSE
jgi:hypothetical protein